jgi:hypothetical protein
VIRRKKYFLPDYFGSGDKPFLGNDVASFRWKGKNFSNSPAVGDETSCDSDGVIVFFSFKNTSSQSGKWKPIQRKVVQV